ncbi:hypothetical protein QVD17_10555 [Tagetes erecta]|uniref:Uncharacterized protein n=1 Tax=Tagetes erecta TaxID=13708 RepID=A0AAD8L6R4_TARER|nr:hypothetical protein QVD17_10555 [Tagetes erecta]
MLSPTRLARKSSTSRTPIAIPGHILRPAPNGIISKSLPLKPISLFKNLSAAYNSIIISFSWYEKWSCMV